MSKKPKIPNISYQLLQSGQSLFEAVLAIALIAFVMITVVSLSTVATRNSIASRNKTEANRYAQQAIEWLREERDGQYTNLSDHTGSYCLKELNWNNSGACTDETISGTAFKRGVVLTDDGGGITAIVTVGWSDGQGYHEVRNATIFTDWR